jgi:hypothetical protein
MAIAYAAWEGDLEEVCRLAEQDRRLLDINRWDKTPLTAAAGSGYVEVLRFLLGARAQVNLRGPLGGSPLDEACDRGAHEPAPCSLHMGRMLRRRG